MKMNLSVLDHNGKYLGSAESMGMARRMHQTHYDSTDPDRARSYAGLMTDGSLQIGYATPVFYKDGQL